MIIIGVKEITILGSHLLFHTQLVDLFAINYLFLLKKNLPGYKIKNKLKNENFCSKMISLF